MSKRMKRALAWIMALALIVGFIPAQSASAAVNPKAGTAKKTTDVVVSTQANLKKALKDKKVTKVTIKSSAAKKFSIPEGDYGKKALVVNAPKSDVTNRGVFKSITIQAIKANTWTERAVGNNIKVTASSASIVVGTEGNVASLNLAKKDAKVFVKVNGEMESLVVSKEAKVDLRANGKLGEVELKAPAVLAIEGKTEKIELVVSKAAKGAEIKTSVPVEAKVSANIDLKLEKGAEGSLVDKTSKNVEVKVDNQTSASVDVTTEGKDKQSVDSGKQGTVGPKDTAVTQPSSGGSNTPTPTPEPEPDPDPEPEDDFIVVFDMQEALKDKAEGTVFSSYTELNGLILGSGGTTTIVVNEDGTKSLEVTNRDKDYYGVQLKGTDLNLEAGKEYTFYVKGTIAEKAAMQFSETKSWSGNIFYKGDVEGAYEYTETITSLPATIAGNTLILKPGAANVDFTVNQILITRPKNETPVVIPETETVTVQVGGADPQWSLYDSDEHELTLGNEPEAFTLTCEFDTLIKLTDFAAGSGDLRIHTADSAMNDYFIDDLTITVNGDTKYDMQTDSKIVIGSTFSSDMLANSGTITTTVVANESKKALSVTERMASWSGIIIKYNKLTELIGEDGTNIVLTIIGRVVPSPIPEPLPADAETWMDVPSLKDAYKDCFLIGNIISSGTGVGRMDNAETTAGLKKHFNVVTPENEMKPDSYGSTGVDTYNFATADKIVNWAKANDILVQGHTLSWHSQSPNWLNTGLTRAEAKVNLENFIKNVAGHFEETARETVFAWDVLNEAHMERSTDWKANLRTGDDGSNASKWYGAYANGAGAGESGADYIYDAFKFARKYAPTATLYYNDFNDDNATKSTAIANMVIDINNRWLVDSDNKDTSRKLIEGVGMQSHYSTNVSVKNVEASIERFIAAGVKVSITELDVGTTDKTEAGYIKQAQVYAQLFQVYKKHSDDIERVTFWGLTDSLSWRAANNPLIFDKDFVAKEAFYAVIDPDDYLEKHPTDVVVAKPKTSVAVKGTPTMNSEVIDDIWNTAVTLNADRFVEGTKAYPDFAVGEFKVMWDEANLYVLGIVTDEQVGATASAEYLQDCVEVFFSPNNNKGGAKLSGDGQHRVNCNNLVSGDSRNGLESVVWKTNTGYVVKLKLPFNDVAPEVGKEIGFDCQVNDEGRENNGTRNSVAVWCDTSNGLAYNDTSAWGTLILVNDANEKVLIRDTAVGNAFRGRPSGETISERLDSADWAGVETLSISKWTTNGGDSIFGTTRVAGKAQVKWDETMLYVRVEVEDSDLNTQNADNYLKDCVEVYINDTGANGGQSRLTYNNLKDGPVTGGDALIKQINNGYIAYLEIPHGLTEPQSGALVKFDVQISDATAPTNNRTGIATWSDWTANGWESAEYFGKLILS